MSIRWRGIFPAMTTKFTQDDKLDLPLLQRNIEAQIEAGIDGLILGGTLGEASVLTNSEKETLVKFAVQITNGRIPVLLNIAEGSTSEALKQAEYAQRWGARGLMMLPPMRYKTDHQETVTYFKTVADATSLPIMIYNNPVDYKTEITLDMFEEMIECSNIQAVKESTRDVSNVTRLNDFENPMSGLIDQRLVPRLISLEESYWPHGAITCMLAPATKPCRSLAKSGSLTAGAP